MIKLIKLLKELNIQPKTPIGQGGEQIVYPSKIKSGFVIKKLYDEWESEDWAERIQISKQYPEVFAKVDKVDFDKGYIVQEKLDEKSLTKDLNELNDYLIKNDILFRNEQGEEEYYEEEEFGDLEDVLEILVAFPNRINMLLDNTPYEKTLKPKLKDFLERLNNAGFNKETGNIIRDVRIDNVGYDTAGKIKILDFLLGSH
jgi:hypothetical protein